jgi:hypothetical protein
MSLPNVSEVCTASIIRAMRPLKSHKVSSCLLGNRVSIPGRDGDLPRPLQGREGILAGLTVLVFAAVMV